MGKQVVPVVTEILTDGLHEHPAVKAWCELRGNSSQPDSIHVLRRGKKSSIYRLKGAGPGKTTIIAKQCKQETGVVERMVYEELLPSVADRSLHFYGFVPEPQSGFCWLFLEDAGDMPFVQDNPDHRALAARWLANLHMTEVPAPLQARLPSYNLGQRLELLRFNRAKLLDHLGRNPFLFAEDVEVLQKVVRQCDTLEAHWPEIEAICAAMPPTVVHGDFVRKNVRVQNGSAGLALLVFDWEYSGWGVSAVDLAQFVGGVPSPDLGVYWEVVRRKYPDRNRHDVVRAAASGNLLRTLDAMNWDTMLLEFGSRRRVLKPVACLRIYESRLTPALGAFGWASA